MVEPGIGRLELANGGHGVDLNFGTLTCQACAGPVSDVLVHAGPDILGSDEALCGSYARMGQTMEVVEDLPAEFLGHIWSRCPSTNIAEQGNISGRYGDSL